mmetsp:Transcript_11785/g.12157  ORF Transcript_11785/g.12157 Transcript_11785/m.12157 type:complete len:134 (-) Transcript_11785:110-511(-)
MNQEFETVSELNVNARPWTPQQNQPQQQQQPQINHQQQQLQLQYYQQQLILQQQQHQQQQQFVYNQSRMIPRSHPQINYQQQLQQQQFISSQYYPMNYDSNLKLNRMQYNVNNIPVQFHLSNLSSSNEWQGAA